MFKTHGEACAYFRENKGKMSERELLTFMQHCQDFKTMVLANSEKIVWLDLIDEVELEIAKRSNMIQVNLSSEYKDIIKPSRAILLTISDFKSVNLIAESSRELTRLCLDYFDQNQTRTAVALGIPLRTLKSNLQRYEMEGNLVRHYALRKFS